MNRRSLLKLTGGASLASFMTQRHLDAQEKVQRAVRGTGSPKIKDVQVIATSPAGLRLVVVKILTDQDGLYGYGCGTFTQRADLVVAAVDKYLKPFLIGKPADRIDDTWQAMYNSSYWRNGPVLNNAISGVDQALWDIKGRQAGMPVYQVLGGKIARSGGLLRARERRRLSSQVIEQAQKYISQGFRHVRVQVGVPGMAGYGSGRGDVKVAALHSDPVFEPAAYIRRALKLFEECRKQLPEELELLHDVHERVTPTQAVQFAKDVEKFKLFFFEDPLSPEDIAVVPAHPPAVRHTDRHGRVVQQPARVESAHQRTADRLYPRPRHASGRPDTLPQDCDLGRVLSAYAPPGMAPATSRRSDTRPMSLSTWSATTSVSRNTRRSTNRPAKSSQGCPEMKNGYLYANEAPGWGIEINEKAAAKYPFGSGGTGRASKVQRRLGRDPQAGRHDYKAVGHPV